MPSTQRRLTQNSELRFAIDNFVGTAETCDVMGEKHQSRVANLCCAIGREMGLDGKTLGGLRVSSSLHDLGLLRVPQEILQKQAPLNDEEIAIVREHPQLGHQFLSHVEFPWPVAEIVLKHHENFDGSGYPNNLIGMQIPIEARILCVADSVDAITSHRPYRKPVTVMEAAAEVQKMAGSYYDPDVVDAFLKLIHGTNLSVRGWSNRLHLVN